MSKCVQWRADLHQRGTVTTWTSADDSSAGSRTCGGARFGLDLLAFCVGSRSAVPHYLFIFFTPSLKADKRGFKALECLRSLLRLRGECVVSLVCVDSPRTLLAHLARLVRSTKSSRFAPTFCIESVSTRPYNFLIWERSMNKTLLRQSWCSDTLKRLNIDFSSTVTPIDSVELSGGITWAALCALETLLQTVGVLGVPSVVAFLTVPLLSCFGAGRYHTCTYTQTQHNVFIHLAHS